MQYHLGEARGNLSVAGDEYGRVSGDIRHNLNPTSHIPHSLFTIHH